MVAKDVASNVLVVDQGVDSPYLMSTMLRSEPAHWIAGQAPAGDFRCTAQHRYRQHEEDCDVILQDDGSLLVRFDHPQRAVTPGQSLVLYAGEVCLGGAVIASTDAPLERLA